MLTRHRLAWIGILCPACGCAIIAGVDHDYHALGSGGGSEECDASIPDVPDAGVVCSGGTGQIVVSVHVITPGADTGAIMAVSNGIPNMQVAGNAALWPTEKAKTWYAISANVPFQTDQFNAFGLCVPPGDYTLQLWDRFGSGGVFDNGVPPNVTYGWQIGNSSRTIVVTAGGVVWVTATNTTADVPDGGNFYGSWATWDYGPCSCEAKCPLGTTCFEATCYDLAYDIRHCGTETHSCTYSDCCQGTCVSQLTDNANCGSCGVSCQDPQTCIAGVCQ